ncbi:MAG TPA: hypothetical protein VEA61_12335 [Allosphingosinicella sp.]|nr:hypothetical protein [Allosphingosinicella sp.]
MFERLMRHAAARAERAAERRRDSIEQALRESAPAGVRVERDGDALALSGRGLRRRLALDPALRWWGRGG